MKNFQVRRCALQMPKSGASPSMDLPPIKEAMQESYYAPPDRTSTSLAHKLDFPCTNDEVEYESLIIGLAFALKMGI